MTKKAKLLIVEDEVAIRNGLIDVFVFHGYQVDSAENGELGLKKSLTGQYDLIVLDIMLPGLDGYEICRRIREQDKEQAIIMLTAKSNDDEIIQGLSLGADDYVAKPFSVAQLVLRVEAVLRRSRHIEQDDDFIQLSPQLKIDIRNLSAQKDAEKLSFTRREIEVLQYLQQYSSRPVSREELLNKVWGYDKNLELETRTVDIHIAKIRRKIEPDPKSPRYLVTVRGAGYKLTPEPI